MKAFGHWSFARVLLLSAAWFVLSVAAWVYLTVRAFSVDVSQGSGGIGAVSVGVGQIIGAISIVPPLVLNLAWLIARLKSG